MIDFRRQLAEAIGLFCTAVTLATALFPAVPIVHAGPGAHGPGGEHLDQPGSAAVPSSRPRVEARSDLFELVASLQDGELAILVDRFETNEPVLGADLEVESGGRKAKARFRSDRGDYAVADPALVKAVAAPGEHALVFTLRAGNDADLLDGTLVVGARGTARTSSTGRLAHAIETYLTPIAVIVAVIAVLVGLMRSRRRWPSASELLRGRR